MPLIKVSVLSLKISSTSSFLKIETSKSNSKSSLLSKFIPIGFFFFKILGRFIYIFINPFITWGQYYIN